MAMAMAMPVVVSPPHSHPSTPHPHHHHAPYQSNLLLFLQNCTTMHQLKQIHARILRFHTTPSNTLYLYSRLMFFSAFSDLSYASRLLLHTKHPNSFIWNTLIRGYARSNEQHKHQSLLLYHQMLSQGYHQDRYTFPFVLKACALLFAVSEGTQIHAQILKLGFQSNLHVSNSLIHMYGSCGCLDIAHQVFDRMPQRSLVSWNVIIDGFVRSGQFVYAVQLFREMQILGRGGGDSSLMPDGFTMQSVVCACGGLGASSLGIWAHAYMLRKSVRFDEGDDVLMMNSLVDMYSKCGCLDMASQLFDEMVVRDVVSWNAMILGFAMHGRVKEALDLFNSMSMDKGKIISPNSITFIGVLSACNHGGLVEEGKKYFDSMIKDYGIEPRIEHYGCMIDLLGRSGCVDEALDLISVMPMKPDAIIWRSILDACRKGNTRIELSERVAQQALELEGSNSGVYVLLSKVYASANRWNDVGLVRSEMSMRGIKKDPGCSSIEMNGVVHEFVAGDTSHARARELYEVLDVIEERLKLVGYVPELSQAMIAEPDRSKQWSLRLHSERIAIALGLLDTREGTPIRVMKNLRVCEDCHNVIKLISKVFGREIIVRDRARFHQFKDGSCSCMDYW